MVLPLYRVLSLVIRVFSKPMVTWIKNKHLKSDSGSSSPFIRNGFISLGNTYNKAELWINRKFLKMESKIAQRQLNEQLAIEKGIQFFYEIIFYSIVIGLPVYQMLRASNEAKAKSKALDQKLKRIDQNLEKIVNRQEEFNSMKKTIEQLKKNEQERKISRIIGTPVIKIQVKPASQNIIFSRMAIKESKEASTQTQGEEGEKSKAQDKGEEKIS